MKARLILSFFLVTCVSCERDISDAILFSIHSQETEQIVKGWFHEDTLTVFMPSYADLSEIKLINNSDAEITISDQIVVENSILPKEFDTCYDLTIGGGGKYVIEFLRSNSLPTMFVSTESGSEEFINSDKKNKEKCSITVIDSLGSLLYRSDSMSSVIRGRGNSTWKEKKKPYTIKLEKKYPFLGMNSAKKWLLLANAFDESNLRNKIVYDFGRGLEYGYVPDSRYADVFINGEYKGLYLITEKVECKKSRLWKEDCDSLYLFHQSSPGQAVGKNSFISHYSQNIVFDYPEKTSKQDTPYLMELVNDMEDLIMGNEENSFIDKLDIESWAIKYLIDDIFENTDCNFLSSYFYVTITKGNVKYYGGPIWDYDLSIGNNWANYEPDMFFAKRVWKGKYTYTPYYNSLLNHKSFKIMMKDVYFNRMHPRLDSLLEGGIRKKANRIAKSSFLNSKRWKKDFERIQKERHSALNRSVDSLICHLKARVKVLDNLYSNDSSYVLVSYETTARKNEYYYKMLKRGDHLRDLPSADSLGYDILIWKDKDKSESFNFERPLMEDVILNIDEDRSQKRFEIKEFKDKIKKAIHKLL